MNLKDTYCVTFIAKWTANDFPQEMKLYDCVVWVYNISFYSNERCYIMLVLLPKCCHMFVNSIVALFHMDVYFVSGNITTYTPEIHISYPSKFIL